MKLFRDKKGIVRINLNPKKKKPSWKDKLLSKKQWTTAPTFKKWGATGAGGVAKGAKSLWLQAKAVKAQQSQASAAARMARGDREPPMWLLFFLFLIVHVCDAALNYQFPLERFYLHFSFALVVYVILRMYNVEKRTCVEAFVIGLIVLILPVLLYNYILPAFNQLGTFSIDNMGYVVAIIMLCFPVWWLYLLGIPHKRGLLDGLTILFYIGLAFLFLPTTIIAMAQEAGISPEELPFGLAEVVDDTGRPVSAVEVAKRTATVITKRAKKAVTVIPQKVEDMFYRQVRQAAGDFYVGRVEENRQHPLGVYLEDVKPAALSFYEDETVTVWGTLRARTLDVDKELNVSLGCYSPAVGERYIKGLHEFDPGEVDPKGPQSLANFEMMDIACRFTPDKLTPGQNQVFFNASFAFRTDSYMKTYFMDKQSMRSLHRQKIDPLQQYNIFDKNPIAVYTNGPVGVGMRTLKTEFGSLVPVDSQTSFLFGLTLSNKWEGKVARFTDVFIKLPPGTDFDKDTCDFVPEKVDCANPGNAVTLCDPNDQSQVIYRVADHSERDYVLRILKRGLDRLFKVDKFITLNCKVKIENQDALLGVTPLATQYFKVTTFYDYVLVKGTALNRKRVPEFSGPFAQSPLAFDQVDEGFKPSTKPGTIKQWEAERIKEIVQQYEKELKDASRTTGVPRQMLVAIAMKESGGKPTAISQTSCVGIAQFCGGTAKAYPDLFPKLKGCCKKTDTEKYHCQDERKSCGGEKVSTWCASGTYLCSADPGDPNYDSRFNAAMSFKAMGRLHGRNYKKFTNYGAANELALLSYNAGSGVAKLAVKAAIATSGNDNPRWPEIYVQLTPELFKRASSNYNKDYFSRNDDKNLKRKIKNLAPYVSRIMTYANYAHRELYPVEQQAS